jgi:hypothetical protein
MPPCSQLRILWSARALLVAAHLIKRKNASKRLTQGNIFCSFLGVRWCWPALPVGNRSGQSSANLRKGGLDPLLVVKPVAEFCINLAREVPVESAEGQAVVVLDAAIGYVERGEGCSETFTEIFAE